MGPIVCYVETEPWERSLERRPARLQGGGERLPAARRRSVFLAAGFSGHPGHDPTGVAQQADFPGREWLEAAHLRAVVAREGPVQRQRGLVGPAAIAAVPASKTRAHNAPIRLATDFNLDATRRRCRPSASPQSPAPDAIVARTVSAPLEISNVLAPARSGLMPDLRGLSARDAVRVLTRIGMSARMNGDALPAHQIGQ